MYFPLLFVGEDHAKYFIRLIHSKGPDDAFTVCKNPVRVLWEKVPVCFSIVLLLFHLPCLVCKRLSNLGMDFTPLPQATCRITFPCFLTRLPIHWHKLLRELYMKIVPQQAKSNHCSRGWTHMSEKFNLQ